MRHGLLAALLALLATPLLAQLAATPDPGSVVGPPRGQALSGAALDARTEEVASLLRCPVCQGLSVADSPATMAQSMKAQVRELLAKGYEREQILAYFEHSYGEFVRLEPPLRGVNWLVWGAPLAGLAAGLGVVVFALKRARGGRGADALEPSAAAVPGPDTLPEDPRLAAYVLQVRELAYGWPGGARPKQGAP
jgi:cytochrome c-type biogenesis protein CcmH